MRRTALLCILALLVAGCAAPEAPGGPTRGTPTSQLTPGPDTPGPDAGTPPPAVTIRFSAERAHQHVVDQVLHPNGSIRYRVPGTEGNREVAAYIADSLGSNGWNASYQWFNATYGCEEVAMHNVVGERVGTSGRTVLIGAHYDTRPIAEKDPDPENRTKPIPGAGDGASGVAVLLELARVLPRLNDTVRLVFFDGEDGGGYAGSGTDASCTDWIEGSRAYAASLSDEEAALTRAFILVDMVSDKDLRLPWEMNGRNRGGALLQDALYATAHGLGHRQFVNETGYAITDDHVPFLERNIPSVDLIHLEPGRFFPWWHHTQADDLDQVHPPSLAAVGQTLEMWLQQSDWRG